MEYNFVEDMEVDKGNLDEECCKQSILCEKWGRLFSQSKRKLFEAEEKVKTVRSQIIRAVQTEQIPIGTKITDKNVEAFYRTHPDYISAKDEYGEALDEHGYFEQAVYAINQKKESLGYLVQLYTSNYFSKIKESSKCVDKPMKKQSPLPRRKRNK